MGLHLSSRWYVVPLVEIIVSFFNDKIVIKSAVQTVSETAPAQHRTMVYQAQLLYAQHGIKAFSNGLGTTLLRAFPVNAVTLFVYEKTSTEIKQYYVSEDD